MLKINSLHLQVLRNSIVPKFLDIFSDENKRQRIENYFSQILPTKTFGMSEDAYLQSTNLSKNDIVKSSIECAQLGFLKEDIGYLSEYFLPLCNAMTLRINANSNTTIYLEILYILSYAQQIRELIDLHPKNYSNHYGTKYRSSSEMSLIKSHVSHLEERLNNPFFAIDNPELIKITQMQIKLIKIFQAKEYKYLSHSFNWLDCFIGLDTKILYLSPQELKAIRQVLSLFNGIRTTKEAYVKSFMIIVSIQSQLTTDDTQRNSLYAESILKIAKYLFDDVFTLDGKKKKPTLTFKESHLTKPMYTKTIINQTPIYAYITGKQEDFLLTQINASFADIMKIPELDLFDRQSAASLTVAPLRNLYLGFEELGFSKKDIRTLLEISQAMSE